MNRGTLRRAWPAAALLACAVLSGCATSYTDATSPLNWTGGYYDKPGPGKLVTVGFAANGYTNAETVRRYVLRRACEVVQEGGKGHFMAYTSLEHAAAGLPVGEDLGIQALGGKPFSHIYVLPLDEPRKGSLNAAEVLERVTAEMAKKEG